MGRRRHAGDRISPPRVKGDQIGPHGGRVQLDRAMAARPRPLLDRSRRLRFPLQIRGSILRVTLAGEEISYDLESGPELTLTHVDEEIRLSPAEPSATRSCLGW